MTTSEQNFDLNAEDLLRLISKTAKLHKLPGISIKQWKVMLPVVSEYLKIQALKNIKTNEPKPLSYQEIQIIRKMVEEGWSGSIAGSVFISTIDSMANK